MCVERRNLCANFVPASKSLYTGKIASILLSSKPPSRNPDYETVTLPCRGSLLLRQAPKQAIMGVPKSFLLCYL